MSALAMDVRCDWCGERRDWPVRVAGCSDPEQHDRQFKAETTELLVALDRRWDQ